MNPVLGAAKVDKILSQFSQMYRNENYIAEQIMPVLKVKEKTGKFAKYGKENLRTYANQIYRAPGTRAHTVDYSVSQGSYSCFERSLEKLVPDEFVNNTDDPYDPKRDATAVLLDNILANQESVLATAMSDTAIISQNVTLSGTNQWSDKTNSDPIANIRTAITTVRTATGLRPNTMVIGITAWEDLKDHPDVREQLKYTNGGQPSDDQLSAWVKSYFRLNDVFIGDAVNNIAEEGQTDSLADIWGGHCWLLHRTAAPTLMKATFGLTLADVPTMVDVYREEPKLADVVRVRKSFDQTIMDAALCYLIKNAT